jgi:hypothetical protein
MAKSTPSQIEIWYDNAGGTLVDISQYVQSLGGVDIENIVEETHTFGDSWEESTPIGIGKLGAIEVAGLYDDTANTGPNALFASQLPTDPNSNTRTLKIVWGPTNATYSSFETILVKFNRQPDRSALTKFSATLQPTGAVTEAP